MIPSPAKKCQGWDDPRQDLRGCPSSRATQTSGRWTPVNHRGLAVSMGTQPWILAATNQDGRAVLC